MVRTKHPRTKLQPEEEIMSIAEKATTLALYESTGILTDLMHESDKVTTCDVCKGPLTGDTFIICNNSPLNKNRETQHPGHTACHECTESERYVGEKGRCVCCLEEMAGGTRSAVGLSGLALQPAIRNMKASQMVCVFRDAGHKSHEAHDAAEQARIQEGADRRAAAVEETRRRREEREAEERARVEAEADARARAAAQAEIDAAEQRAAEAQAEVDAAEKKAKEADQAARQAERETRRREAEARQKAEDEARERIAAAEKRAAEAEKAPAARKRRAPMDPEKKARAKEQRLERKTRVEDYPRICADNELLREQMAAMETAHEALLDRIESLSSLSPEEFKAAMLVALRENRPMGLQPLQEVDGERIDSDSEDEDPTQFNYGAAMRTVD